MAGDLSQPMQAALYAKLIGDSALMSMIQGVYDHVSEGANFPYITMGETESRDSSTFGKNGQAFSLTLHVWSRSRGRKEAQQIMTRIHDLLHKGAMTVAGGEFAGSIYDFGTVLLDPDGLTYHGVARYRAVVMEV